MTRIRRINVSQVEGDGANNTSTNEIRPYGEMGVYQGDNNKLELLIADGVRTNLRNKVLAKGTFYGGDADSSDGLNRDTIKLIPDTQLHYNDGNFGNDQYLIIDPTEGGPGHIHIRAGGTIDNSSADLFLGGEQNNVRVSDVDDRVTVSIDTYTWTFDNNGTLTLPGELAVAATAQAGSTQTIANDSSGGTVGWGPTSLSVAYDANILSTFAVGSTITFQDGSVANITAIEDYTSYIDISWDTPKTGTLFPITLKTIDYADTQPGGQWTFGADGSLTVPKTVYVDNSSLDGSIVGNDGVVIRSTNARDIFIAWEKGTVVNPYPEAPPGTLDAVTANIMLGYGGLSVEVNQEGAGGYWVFQPDQKLRMPTGGDIVDSEGNSVLGGGGGDATGVSRSDDNLIIRLTDPNNDGLELRSLLVNGSDADVASTVLGSDGFVIRTNSNVSQQQWAFGSDGGLTFPDTTVQTTAFTGTGAITFTANEIEGNTFGGTGTLLTKTVDNTGNDYSTGSGSLGFLNFGADGDIQNVKAGWTVTFASGATRTVLQDAYQPLGTYWNIGFTSAYVWSAGDVMPVTFSSPDYVAGTDPQVTLTAGTKSWTFDDAGTLTFPSGMTIETAYGGTPRLVIDSKTNYVDIRSDSNILIGYNESGGNVTIGNGTSGRVDILGPKFRVTATVPTSSTGADGDMVGMIAVGGGYLYVCTANWVSPGTADIWTRTTLTTGAW